MRRGRRARTSNNADLCRRCHARLLTEQQWQGLHGGAGLTVGVGSVFEVLEQHEADRTKAIEDRNRVGITCAGCGEHYCTECMTDLAETHPISGGKACLACGGRMKAYSPLT